VVSYCTAKYAVVGLSLALRVEAAAMGVRVSVLCPGVIRTPGLEIAPYAKRTQPPSPEKVRAYWEHFRPMDPNAFAVRVLKAVARNRAIIIVPAWWKLAWWFNRLSPWLGERLARIGLANMKATLEEPAAAGPPKQASDRGRHSPFLGSRIRLPSGVTLRPDSVPLR
jgi:short-subunit dehydrogenase